MNSKKNARHGSLVCLIQALVGLDTTVELRYERSVRGTIAHVDDHMNIQMTGVVCHSLHIPKNVNAIDAITNKLDQSKHKPPQRRRMFKRREEKLQKEKAEVRAKILGRGRGNLPPNAQTTI
ncbi:uncharacterized protein [Dysidea avara]|uniref:uncharacterized protein isoform X4 n=1 Tax=Dysidea avara TaxID=196820 RepID=UPI003317B67C